MPGSRSLASSRRDHACRDSTCPWHLLVGVGSQSGLFLQEVSDNFIAVFPAFLHPAQQPDFREVLDVQRQGQHLVAQSHIDD